MFRKYFCEEKGERKRKRERERAAAAAGLARTRFALLCLARKKKEIGLRKMSTSSRSGKKHFVDDVSTAVEDCLLGLVASSTGPRLQLVQGFPEIKVVVDADFCAKSPSERPVALISGGGSGHEPGQAGYVGEGMLAAAVCGDIFASPSAEAVYKAIKATCGEKGRKGDIVGAFHSTPLHSILFHWIPCKGYATPAKVVSFRIRYDTAGEQGAP